MILDLRIPMGLMFTVTGIILTFFGFVTRHDAALYAKSLGINANFWWGLVMFAFGLTMYITGVRRQHRIEKNPPPFPEESEMRHGMH
jgi:membrane protein implicated in regulation of membrane protease activity